MGWCLSRLFVIELVDKIRFLPVRAFERMIWIPAGRDLPARGLRILGPRSTGFQYQTGGGDACSGARRLSLAGQGRCAEDREHAGAAAFPFPILGIDSDNGSKFINWEPFRWCEQENRRPRPRRRRVNGSGNSRPNGPRSTPAIGRLWRNVPFLDWDAEIRRVICSTNLIESLNARYRPSSAAADRR